MNLAAEALSARGFVAPRVQIHSDMPARRFPPQAKIALIVKIHSFLTGC
jgi:hypothetical protein